MRGKGSAIRRRSGRGFTLVETLIVLAIIGLALLIGIPTFGTFLRRARVDSSARQLEMTFLSTRVQAVRQGNTIGVVFSNDPSAADPIGFARPMIFIDANANGTFDTGETIIRQSPLPVPKGIHLAIDTMDRPSGDPSATAATVAYVFTAAGAELPASSGNGKAVYVLDDYGNVLEVSVPIVGSGKVAMTKRLVSGGTNSYVAQPWTWY